MTEKHKCPVCGKFDFDYYNSMDFCDICFNYTSCNNCSEGYDYFNGKCILQIKNCREYLNESLCDKCDDNFTFNEDNRSVCLSKENFTGDYYTKDNGISYYPCDNEIENCDIFDCALEPY